MGKGNNMPEMLTNVIPRSQIYHFLTPGQNPWAPIGSQLHINHFTSHIVVSGHHQTYRTDILRFLWFDSPHRSHVQKNIFISSSVSSYSHAVSTLH